MIVPFIFRDENYDARSFNDGETLRVRIYREGEDRPIFESEIRNQVLADMQTEAASAGMNEEGFIQLTIEDFKRTIEQAD